MRSQCVRWSVLSLICILAGAWRSQELAFGEGAGEGGDGEPGDDGKGHAADNGQGHGNQQIGAAPRGCQHGQKCQQGGCGCHEAGAYTALAGFDHAGADCLARFGLQDELSEILGHTVDLNTPGSISHYFREEVLGKAEELYVAA